MRQGEGKCPAEMMKGSEFGFAKIELAYSGCIVSTSKREREREREIAREREREEEREGEMSANLNPRN